jgi:hypothetical protein
MLKKTKNKKAIRTHGCWEASMLPVASGFEFNQWMML